LSSGRIHAARDGRPQVFDLPGELGRRQVVQTVEREAAAANDYCPETNSPSRTRAGAAYSTMATPTGRHF
jgi:hypothetical protein